MTTRTARDLPVELVRSILEEAVASAAADKVELPWAASVLLVSQAVHNWMQPIIYADINVTNWNSASLLALIEASHPGFSHTTCMQFVGATVLVWPQWLERETLRKISHVKRLRGPRALFHALTLANGPVKFAPTHLRTDPPVVAESLLCSREAQGTSALTHLHLEYPCPIRVPHGEGLFVPPSLTHLVLAPIIVDNAEHLKQDVMHFLQPACTSVDDEDASSSLQRVVVRIRGLRRPSGDHVATAKSCVKALKHLAVTMQDKRLAVDLSAAEFTFADDGEWMCGEQLWTGEEEAVNARGSPRLRVHDMRRVT